MRILRITIPAVFAAGCSPLADGPVNPPAAITRALPDVPEPARLAKPPAPDPVQSPRLKRVTLSGVVFEGVAFDARRQRLVVVEQQGVPGQRFPDAESAARSIGGIAAVNGGFFTPVGDPLGLVIASGRPFGAWNSASSLGSGVWHADGTGKMAISRRQLLGKARAMAMRELLQAGPLLVGNGRAVGGLENTKSSARTMILWDGGERWWIGRAAPCTLARCAEILATSSPSGWPVKAALNLDGGRSSELWVSEKISGGPLKSRPLWNRPVRNFLVLE